MGDGEVLLTTGEADRVAVVRGVVERRLRQSEAARRLGLSVRQVKRLARRYRERGAAGLASGRRGRRPNNAIDPAVRGEVLDLVRERYPDFGPTFACEKLVEVHGHRLSAETLRGWMIADGLWRPKARREVREHPSRPRRECLGDLVQIDGSPHDWFEGRGPRCTLIVYADDATSRLLATGFHPAETTEAYMTTTRAHFAAHGRPVAYYSDRYGVFRINRRDREGEPTQFVRALRTLDVESIHAGSPQAKGRVERADLTPQDRLVKEMRLRGICGIEAGNAYLPAFMADYNRRFGVAPRNPADAHRAVLHDERELDLILCPQHPRKVTGNLSISFEGGDLPDNWTRQGPPCQCRLKIPQKCRSKIPQSVLWASSLAGGPLGRPAAPLGRRRGRDRGVGADVLGDEVGVLAQPVAGALDLDDDAAPFRRFPHHGQRPRGRVCPAGSSPPRPAGPNRTLRRPRFGLRGQSTPRGRCGERLAPRNRPLLRRGHL